MKNLMANNTMKGLLLAFAGFLCFAITDALGKNLTGDLDVFALNFWISLCSVSFFLLFSPWLGGLSKTLRTKKRKWHLVRAILTGITPLLNFYALAYVSLVNFYTLIFMAPLFTAVFSMILLKERVTPRNWMLIFVGLCGVLTALRPNPQNFGWPEGLIILSAMIFSLRNLTVVKMGPQETALSYGLYGYMAVLLFSAGPVLMDFHLPQAGDALPLICAGVLASIGIMIFSWAFRLAPSSVIASTHYSQILWGILFGMFFFADIPDHWDLIGAGIVVISGIVLVMGERKVYEAEI